MNSLEMRNRTKKFSLDILELLEILPNSKTFKLIENQLGRAALSVGANYRVVSRAKSSNDFINKLKIVEEECDECTFFLEILLEKSVNHKELIQKLLSEANEILAIIVASIKSARNNKSYIKNRKS